MQLDNLETTIQVRTRLDEATIQRYAEALEVGAVFPPVVVYREPGTERYVVADGAHRVEAARRLGRDSIEADLRDGSASDALAFALGCNSAHGLQRTSKDIERAVSLLMATPELTDRYRTHEERARLLKIGVRTWQRYLAAWREREGGSKQEREAKAQARERAAKHTTDVTCHVAGSGDGRVSDSEAPARSPAASDLAATRPAPADHDTCHRSPAHATPATSQVRGSGTCHVSGSGAAESQTDATKPPAVRFLAAINRLMDLTPGEIAAQLDVSHAEQLRSVHRYLGHVLKLLPSPDGFARDAAGNVMLCEPCDGIGCVACADTGLVLTP